MRLFVLFVLVGGLLVLSACEPTSSPVLLINQGGGNGSGSTIVNNFYNVTQNFTNNITNNIINNLTNNITINVTNNITNNVTNNITNNITQNMTMQQIQNLGFNNISQDYSNDSVNWLNISEASNISILETNTANLITSNTTTNGRITLINGSVTQLITDNTTAQGRITNVNTTANNLVTANTTTNGRINTLNTTKANLAGPTFTGVTTCANITISTEGFIKLATVTNPGTCSGTNQGQLYVNNTNKKLTWCNGTAWVAFG